VDKHVVAAVIARDEAEALFIVEKLDRTRCHRSVSVWPGRSTQQKSDRPMIASRQTQRSGMLLLDKLAHHFDGLRWAIAVVAADEFDLSAVDAALLIDHGEIGTLRLAENA
jgi:hypothetical protein